MLLLLFFFVLFAFARNGVPVAVAAFGINSGITEKITDPAVYAGVAWVMTLGSILPLILIPIILKKIQKGVSNVASKNSKWMDVMTAAAFIGLISAFIGRGLAGTGKANADNMILSMSSLYKIVSKKLEEEC